MFSGVRTRPTLDAKREAALLDKDTPIAKRFKYLSQLTESGPEADVRTFYQKNYSAVYTIFLDALNNLDAEAKKKAGKTIPNSDVLLLANILLTLFKYARNIISRRWQQRSLILYLETYLEETNLFSIKKRGVELLLNFVDIMQDNVDSKVFDMVMNIFNFQPFTTDLVLSNGSRVPDPTPVKLPSYPRRTLSDTEKLRLESGKSTVFTPEESLEVFIMFFNFIKTKTDQFDFWWKFFKSRLAPILYPNECKSLELLNKLDDMGYTKNCPTTLHLLVLEMILMGLENPKKSESLYQTDKDIYLFLLIFRQSFLLPTTHYDSLMRMLKTYRSWICRDYFLYAWPDIMERSQNIYFRVFIDNLSQTFYMQGDELAMDVHFGMCYEVLDIFLFFTNMPEKVEFETWSDLLSTMMRIYNHLIQRKASADKYDQQFGTMLERTVMRNLFLIWLKCHPDDSAGTLWNQLYELLQKHFTHESVFTMWRYTLLNLTRTLIHSIFDLPEEYIIGEFLHYETEFYDVVKKNKKNKITPRAHVYPQMKEHFQKMEQGVLLQQWHKMIKMYGFENNNQPGPLHTKKIRVISEVINMLLDISQCEVKVMKGTQVPNFVHSPEANRVLEIFMPWLIEATNRNDESFSDGRYTAYVTLCRIFCNQKSSQPIKMLYLAHFYKVIYLGLTELSSEQKNSRPMEAILLNSQKLFSYGYPGSNALIPSFVNACQIVLRDSSTSSRDLRISAVHLLISVVNLSYYYGDMVLPNLDGSDNEPNTYRKLRGQICKVLMGAIVDDRYSEQQIKAMWGLFIVVHKEITYGVNNSTVGQSGIKFIIDSILSFAMHVNDEVSIASHNVLVSFAQFGLMSHLGTNIVRSIIRTLCDVASSALRDNKLDRANVLHHIYYTLVEVLPYVPIVILEDKELLQSLFGCINAALSILPNLDNLNQLCGSSSHPQNVSSSTSRTPASNPDPRPQSTTGNKLTGQNFNLFGANRDSVNVTSQQQEALKNLQQTENRQDKMSKIVIAAEALLAFTLATYAHFPSPLGPSNMSSKLSEFDLLIETGGITETSPRMHHFVFNGYTLVTAMESPDKPESCRFILRDITGRYCWEQTLVFDPAQATFKELEAHLQASSSSNSTKDSLASISSSSSLNGSTVVSSVATSKSNLDLHHHDHHSALDNPLGHFESTMVDTDDEDEMPKLVEETCVTHFIFNEPLSDQLSNLENYNPLQPMQKREIVLPIQHNVSKKKQKQVLQQQQQQQVEELNHSDDEDSSSQDNHHQLQLDGSSSLVMMDDPQSVIEQLVNSHQSDDSLEEDKVDYPLYDPEIDTDKTDMLEVLQHYVINVFPECQEYSLPSVIPLSEQGIQITGIQEELIEQADEEDRLLEERTEFMEFISATPPCRDPDPSDPMGTVVYKAFRALMNNMGYLSPVNRSSFVRLDPNHRFYRALRQLDKLTERETIKIGVVYVANGQESERKLMRNESGSNAYNEFVQALGWDVDLQTHEGFMGGLDPSLTTGRTAPYYANATTEVIFHVVTKMPNKENDNQQIHKKRHVGNDNVHIVWSEHDRDYRPWTITSQFNFVHIVIYPLQYPLFRVQIHTKKNKDTNAPAMSPFGPLQDGMIVDKESLAPLVRMTAINANKAVRYQQPGYKKPYPTRRELINEIVERFKPVKMTNEEFMKGLFYDQCYVPMIPVQPKVVNKQVLDKVLDVPETPRESFNTPSSVGNESPQSSPQKMVTEEEEMVGEMEEFDDALPVVVSVPADEAPASAVVIVAADAAVEEGVYDDVLEQEDDEYDSDEEVAVIG